MSFFSLLPIYLLGNLHCAGMCGPLVMLLAKHPHRWWYFVGRLFSFSLAGLISAEMGMLLFSFLSRYHIGALFSLSFGAWIFFIGCCLVFKIKLPTPEWLTKKSSQMAAFFLKLLNQKNASSIFTFGFCTLLLPCGQTISVYSIIALECTPANGLMQGALFAIATSPALVAAMHASLLFTAFRKGYSLLMGAVVATAGVLAILRGANELF